MVIARFAINVNLYNFSFKNKLFSLYFIFSHVYIYLLIILQLFVILKISSNAYMKSKMYKDFLIWEGAALFIFPC